MDEIIDSKHFKKVSHTLFIPLMGRAKAKMGRNGFEDKLAQKVVKRLADGDRPKISAQTALGCIERAKIFDQITIATLGHAGPNHGNLISLGSGLCTRPNRIGKLDALFFELDFPEVLELKKNILGEDLLAKQISRNILDFEWMQEIKKELNPGPIVIILEGVSMYLTAETLENLLLNLAQNFPGAHYLMDYLHPIISKFTFLVPSIFATGAKFTWGMPSPDKLLQRLPQLRCINDYSLVSPVLDYYPILNRRLFKKMIPSLYRLAHFQLGSEPKNS